MKEIPKLPMEIIQYILKIKHWTETKNRLEKKLLFPYTDRKGVHNTKLFSRIGRHCWNFALDMNLYEHPMLLYNFIGTTLKKGDVHATLLYKRIWVLDGSDNIDDAKNYEAFYEPLA